MDNMTFGKYIPGNSIIHRLDPRLKICAVFIFLISVFFDAGFIGYGFSYFKSNKTDGLYDVVFDDF